MTITWRHRQIEIKAGEAFWADTGAGLDDNELVALTEERPDVADEIVRQRMQQETVLWKCATASTD